MHSILSLRRYRHDRIAHRHDHAQLVFGLRGQLDFEVAGFGSQVTCQTLAVVPCDTQHACGSTGGSECLVLDVPSAEWLQQRLGDHASASQRLLERPSAFSLNPRQGQLVNWLAASQLQDGVIAQQGAALLLASLVGEREAPPCGLPLAALDAYVDQHVGHPLQVADLARLSGLSVARFHIRFLEETGQTPMDYVRQRRLQRARQLLCASRLPLGEVAAQVGYASQSAFSAALLRAFGQTPSALRRESRDKTH
ncbi:MAG: AraC family transcriptional regulator [Pseudomonas sp.]|uniref:helix-turn-helix domain-containing protein n=1 Tax=Pseudomonas sp. TaxID=306 RepID=UPI00339AFCFE